MMKNNILLMYVFIFFSVFSLIGCDPDNLYTCYNRSSHTVVVQDESNRQISLPPGGTQNIYLISGTLSDLYYSPADLVSATCRKFLIMSP